MKFFLYSLLKLCFWISLFIIIDNNLRIGIKFLFEEDFFKGHEFRELLTLRTLEFILIILLLKNSNHKIFGKINQIKQNIIFSLALIFASVTGALLLNFILTYFDIYLFTLFRPENPSKLFDIELFFTAVLIGPLVEEVCFRGLLWDSLNLKKASKPQIVFSLLLCTLPFTLLHINFSYPLKNQLVMIFMWAICALLTLLLYHWRKNIWLGFSLHASANGMIYFSHHLNI